LLREHPARLLQEWADITLAAMERRGKRFFRRSPQAYFIDNVKNAAAGGRTPPDWWHRLRRSEQQDVNPTTRRNRKCLPTSAMEILCDGPGRSDASMNEAVRSFLQKQN
jgi:hypothetical protein